MKYKLWGSFYLFGYFQPALIRLFHQLILEILKLSEELYLEQKQTFLEGRSSPDFAPEDFEKNYPDRSTIEDLNELGMRQMGFSSWS